MPYTLASSTASGLSNTASPLVLAAVLKFLQHTEESLVLPGALPVSHNAVMSTLSPSTSLCLFPSQKVFLDLL
ncbi:hypothetical protein BDQ17DRAFT_1376120 [Cyathus striatus]|nr:hypothetical protein BDQ17DRAFT_1376120 [Cyathus striatus]